MSCGKLELFGFATRCSNVPKGIIFLLFLRRHNFLLTKNTTMAKYSKVASDKVERAMHEMKKGKLKSGRSDKKVTSRKQAIAIGLSEAREKGAKVPRKTASKSAGGRSKAASKGAKKPATKASGRSSGGTRKSSDSTKKSTPRKTAMKPSGGKKSATKSSGRSGSKSAAARKKSPRKKSASKSSR